MPVLPAQWFSATRDQITQWYEGINFSGEMGATDKNQHTTWGPILV